MSRARDLANLGGSADAGGLTGRSIVINGNMTLAQRGTSSTTNGYGSVDRWQNSYSGGTSTGSQESLTSSDTPYGLGFRNFFRLTNTATASGTSDYRQLVQQIEAQNIANSGWNYTSASSFVTLSFWVRTSVAGKYGIILVANDSPAYQFAFTETLSANTWTKVTKTISGNSNLVFNNDNGAGLTLAIEAWMGSDYTDASATLDSWVAFDTSVYLPTDIVNWAGTSSATFDVTGVQLEVGTTATPFEHEDFGTTLAKCQRYYYKIAVDTTQDSFCMGHCDTTTNANGTLSFAVTMRDSPTALETSGTAGHYQIRSAGANKGGGSVPTFVRATKDTAYIQFGGASGLTAGNAATLRSANTSAYLAWSAEL